MQLLYQKFYKIKKGSYPQKEGTYIHLQYVNLCLLPYNLTIVY